MTLAGSSLASVLSAFLETTTLAAVREALGLADGTEVQTSMSVAAYDRSVFCGDVALMRMANAAGDSLIIAKVAYHCLVNGQTLSCVAAWPLIEKSLHSSRVRVAQDFMLVPSQQLVESCIYSSSSDEAIVLLPAHLR